MYSKLAKRTFTTPAPHSEPMSVEMLVTELTAIKSQLITIAKTPIYTLSDNATGEAEKVNLVAGEMRFGYYLGFDKEAENNFEAMIDSIMEQPEKLGKFFNLFQEDYFENWDVILKFMDEDHEKRQRGIYSYFVTNFKDREVTAAIHSHGDFKWTLASFQQKIINYFQQLILVKDRILVDAPAISSAYTTDPKTASLPEITKHQHLQAVIAAEHKIVLDIMNAPQQQHILSNSGNK